MLKMLRNRLNLLNLVFLVNLINRKTGGCKNLLDCYDKEVNIKYLCNYMEAIQNFEEIAEKVLRSKLKNYYNNQRSADQAWKACKGLIYEYAVYKTIKQIIDNNNYLKNKIKVIYNKKELKNLKDQIVFYNWSKIYPDIDIVIIDKQTEQIKIIISCKTSLRERLTETAFWKRELEKNGKNIKLFFITSNKDNELQKEINRYIIFHIIDYTFITDPKRYYELIFYLRKKYGKKKNFNNLILKVKCINQVEYVLEELFL